MKTKEIIATLHIENGVKAKDQKAFFNTMLAELKSGYEKFGNVDSERHFDAAVKDLNGKWKSISKQIRGGISDGLWNFFYATEIVAMKNQLCPTWANRKRTEHERYEERKRKAIARREAKAFGYGDVE